MWPLLPFFCLLEMMGKWTVRLLRGAWLLVCGHVTALGGDVMATDLRSSISAESSSELSSPCPSQQGTSFFRLQGAAAEETPCKSTCQWHCLQDEIGQFPAKRTAGWGPLEPHRWHLSGTSVSTYYLLHCRLCRQQKDDPTIG